MSRVLKSLRLLCAVSVWLFFGQVFAATEINLYQERVVVSENANQSEQNEAIESAFRRLLVRVTGIQQVLDYPAINEALKNGSKYLATFRFEPSDEFFTNVLGEKVPTKSMNLTFDKKTVDALLVQNRLPVWGAKRPDVLIWLADRLEGQDHILADAEESDIALLMEAESQHRGIPYLLPIMDLTDTLSLSFSEVYGLFSRDIEEASLRYEPEAVLAGRLMRDGEELYKADWLMLFKGERLRLPTVSGSLEFVIAQGMDLVAQRLSEQYALILDPLLLGNLSVDVQGVRDLNDFAALESYLKSINIITKVTLSRYSEEGVSFNVEISGDQSQLADVLALDGQLIPMEEGTLEEQLDSQLLFEWRGQ